LVATIIATYGLVVVLVGALFEGETIVVVTGFAAPSGPASMVLAASQP